MKILIIGSGGREHALAWKLSQEAEVHAAPGNPGMVSCAQCHSVAVSDHYGLVGLARKIGADLVVVGPENPLIDGVADVMRTVGLNVFGPGRDGAQLEGSKAFAKTLMHEAYVPTASYKICTDPQSAIQFARDLASEGKHVAVKASGAAFGKGVVVCSSAADAEDAIDMMLVKKEFLEAGETIVVEERLYGREFSLLSLCTDGGFLSLPLAQDYKRVGTGDTGLNTGGMGSYSPLEWVSPDLLRQTEERVVAPMLGALEERSIPFRGTLFSGLLVQDGVPYCLEYNVRFGDPETQSVVARIGKGLAAALLACAKGESIPDVEVLERSAVTVVLASEGYPGKYRKGVPISLPADLGPNAVVFHAGTAVQDGQLVTGGGRVLAVTGWGDTLESARLHAYDAVSKISFEGMHYRTDIGDS